MYHPWRQLRALEHVTLHLAADLPAGVRGVTDGHSTIWLRDTLSQTERRCTLTHELVHLRHRHRGHQDEEVEEQVRREVAHLLLPDVHHLAKVLHYSHDAYEAAHELWVTADVLHTRLAHLHPAERGAVMGRLRGI